MNRIKEFYIKFKIFSLKSIFNKKVIVGKDRSRCFIFLAADYGNLGDVAITYAQKKFLYQKFPDHEVIEVPCGRSLSLLYSIKRGIKKEDIVTVVGGGNMGDRYFDIELLRLLVVETFKKNQIILFPQTIDYSDTKEAKSLLKLSQKIYPKAKNLTMIAREKVSFDKMKTFYPSVNVMLTPDIVMSLDERKDVERDNIAILCLRNDDEKASGTDTIIEEIKENLQKQGLSLLYRDTHIGGRRYSEDEKYKRLKDLWDDFRRAKIVVTDRLHGMIFAYITGTPAIILPNSNFKVEACYEWIRNKSNMLFIGDNIFSPNHISSVFKETPFLPLEDSLFARIVS